MNEKTMEHQRLKRTTKLWQNKNQCKYWSRQIYSIQIFMNIPVEGSKEIIAMLSTPLRVALSQTAFKFSMILLTLKSCSVICWCFEILWSLSLIRSLLMVVDVVVVGWMSLFAKKDRLECVVIAVESSQILKFSVYTISSQV